MGNIIDPNDLVQQPDSAFWSAPVSRRAFQTELHKIAKNLAYLSNAADTASIMLNFIMEKKLMLGKTPEQIRDEIENFVEEKKAQAAALRANSIAQVGTIDGPSDR